MREHGLHARGVRAGGYDLLPETLQAISDRDLDFAIDQQPYLQGFLPVLQLFLDRYSGGLVAPADTNTGLNFVTRANVAEYVTTKSRYEGSASRESYPGGIRNRRSAIARGLHYCYRGVVLSRFATLVRFAQRWRIPWGCEEQPIQEAPSSASQR